LGRSFVLAHEMGHKYIFKIFLKNIEIIYSMGMVHDGVQNQCGRSCCLMSAVNGAGKTTWSRFRKYFKILFYKNCSCSVREFNAFLLQME
jgi:hypothetical protein